jgi:hypothetical protein
MLIDAVIDKLGYRQGLGERGGVISEWPYEIAIPDKATLDEWVADYTKKVLYKTKRYESYPSVQDQLLMLWDAMDSGEIPQATSFYDTIKAINDANPPPA